MGALLRQANPDLTWRDLKLILAASARKNDAANTGWAEGARKYGVDSYTDRYHFNHEYGFGVVDAKAAVDIARGWTNVPTLESGSAANRSATEIPPPSGSTPETVTTTLTLDTEIRFAEFVEINTDFEHRSFRDMDIELVSPSGAVSKLAVPFNTRRYTTTYTRPDDTTFDGPYFVRLDGEFRFGSARHLGEDPNGVWTLRLTDHFPEPGGTLRSWSIKVYGHVSRPDPPTINTPITAGADSLTVAWSAPGETGGPDITSYDLRYIRTDVDETVDANWTLAEAWTTGSGPLQYVLTGLAGGTQYDLQVRAVNAAGESEWSATVTETTAPPVLPGTPTGLKALVVAVEAQIVLSWTAPASSGGASITGYKIESSDDGGDPWVEVYTTTSAATSYTDEGDDSNGPTFGAGVMRHYRVSAINSVGTGPPSNVAIATPDACRDPLGLLTAPVTRMGAWASECMSEGRPGSLARYYTFSLGQPKRVAVYLTSAVDTYLVLRDGERKTGDPLHQNDDVLVGRNPNSRIEKNLPAGTYTVEATTYGRGVPGGFTVDVRVITCVRDLPRLTETFNTPGTLSSECGSTKREGGYARSYRFTLGEPMNLKIDLTSSLDTYLYVLGADGMVYENDDVAPGRNPNSRIEKNFGAGDYTVEATTYGPMIEGEFILNIGVTAP